MRSIMAKFAFRVDSSRLRRISEDVEGTNLQLKLQAARKALLKWQKDNPEAARRQAAAWFDARLLRGFARYLARDEMGESTAHDE
jgi:hypothetical protein